MASAIGNLFWQGFNGGPKITWVKSKQQLKWYTIGSIFMERKHTKMSRIFDMVVKRGRRTQKERVMQHVSNIELFTINFLIRDQKVTHD